MILITLFQEDKIFGTNANVAYGPQLQIHGFIVKLILFTVCTPGMLRLDYPILHLL